MTISVKLKELRKKFRLKQTDLANSLRVSPQAVSKWERDENYPDIFLIKKIASLFDVSIDYLLGSYEEGRDVFEATVFCSSLNRFAEKGGRLSAKELAQWTNVLFHHMTDVALKHGGVPVKYTGDGFLCFFSGAGHAERAVKAAKEIDRTSAGRETVIFLHAGEVYFGLAGHPDYASRDIYGDTVNKAFLMLGAFSKKVQKGVGVSAETKVASRGKHTFRKISGLSSPLLKDRPDVYQVTK